MKYYQRRFKVGEREAFPGKLRESCPFPLENE